MFLGKNKKIPCPQWITLVWSSFLPSGWWPCRTCLTHSSVSSLKYLYLLVTCFGNVESRVGIGSRMELMKGMWCAKTFLQLAQVCLEMNHRCTVITGGGDGCGDHLPWKWCVLCKYGKSEVQFKLYFRKVNSLIIVESIAIILPIAKI